MTYLSEKRKAFALEKIKTLKKGSGRYSRVLRKANLTEQEVIQRTTKKPRKIIKEKPSDKDTKND